MDDRMSQDQTDDDVDPSLPILTLEDAIDTEPFQFRPLISEQEPATQTRDERVQNADQRHRSRVNILRRYSRLIILQKCHFKNPLFLHNHHTYFVVYFYLQTEHKWPFKRWNSKNPS